MGGTLGTRAGTAAEWLAALDRGGMEMTILYPTPGLGIGWVREPDWAVALCQAYNDFVAEEILKVSPRLQAVCLLPLQEPEEAIKVVMLPIGATAFTPERFTAAALSVASVLITVR